MEYNQSTQLDLNFEGFYKYSGRPKKKVWLERTYMVPMFLLDVVKSTYVQEIQTKLGDEAAICTRERTSEQLKGQNDIEI